jgi:hypothetical protein
MGGVVFCVAYELFNFLHYIETFMVDAWLDYCFWIVVFWYYQNERIPKLLKL